MEIIIGIGIFCTIVLLIEGIYFVYKSSRKQEQKKVKKRLKAVSSVRSENGAEINILRNRILSDVSWLNKLLLRLPRLNALDRFLEQANTKHSLGVYIFLTILLISCGYLIASMIAVNFLLKLFLAGILGSLPFFSLYAAKRSRMLKFERQLPDALDLIVRSLKAGHAFSGGLKMVADEFDDPIGNEFEKVFDEINFGVGVPAALLNLTERVDCPDLKFFVVSVIIQRETGGNLAEVLAKIAQLIRERFKLQGRVRVLAAEGKLSAFTLIALPFIMAFYLLIVNPDYLKLLFVDHLGRVLITAAIVMMILGSLVMKKMVSIKV
jgi:tight adherence protein B